MSHDDLSIVKNVMADQRIEKLDQLFVKFRFVLFGHPLKIFQRLCKTVTYFDVFAPKLT